MELKVHGDLTVEINGWAFDAVIEIPCTYKRMLCWLCPRSHVFISGIFVSIRTIGKWYTFLSGHSLKYETDIFYTSKTQGAS